jgi:hypothetical protein
MSKHTPGPYVFEQRGEDFTLWGKGRARVLTISAGVLPILPDQKLLAAAPELYEALGAIAVLLATAVPIDYKRDCFAALAIANKAIARAQGGGE